MGQQRGRGWQNERFKGEEGRSGPEKGISRQEAAQSSTSNFAGTILGNFTVAAKAYPGAREVSFTARGSPKTSFPILDTLGSRSGTTASQHRKLVRIALLVMC